MTWAANIQISDILIPQPTQNDGGVQPCYAGDYDYATAQGQHAFVTWTDGRVAVSGVQVQSVEFATFPSRNPEHPSTFHRRAADRLPSFFVCE